MIQFTNIKLNDSLSVDYLMEYQSIKNYQSLNTVFENGFNSNYIVDSFEGNQTDCEVSCNLNDNCDGYVWFENNSNYCNLLNNITGKSYTNFTSESYQKIVIHHPPFRGICNKRNCIISLSDQRNVTLYIDLNLKWNYRPGEPVNTTYNGLSFEF